MPSDANSHHKARRIWSDYGQLILENIILPVTIVLVATTIFAPASEAAWRAITCQG